MENIYHELNLARKLRPKTFDDVIGQDLSIRILKNSLYLKKFFPVYIFSGQRGCGKTSSARIFAAAINCEKLSDFQTDPKNYSVPCMQCSSCRSMSELSHPDFIEIDAASHTGVDNVRQILDSAVHVPLVGGRKVYLIDEAHMLSKAAFNAFLKMLEEPPKSVFFILATTELQKIPDTVRSRAFQVFFESINFKDLKNYFLKICEEEKINIASEALDLIIQEGEGSARDSINLLERVRLASERVSQETVLEMLGKIGYSKLFELFDILIAQQPTRLFSYLDEIAFEKRSPQGIWDMLILLCRYLLWLKYDVKELPGIWGQNIDKLKALSSNCSINRLNAIMQLFWSQESIFLRSTQKHLFLETVLLQICEQVNVVDLENLIKSCSHNSSSGGKKIEFIKPEIAKSGFDKLGLGITQSSKEETPQSPLPQEHKNTDEKVVSKEKSVTLTDSSAQSTPWTNLLQKIEGLQDPMLASIFKQAKFLGLDAQTRAINIALLNNSPFFQDKIKDSIAILRPVIDEVFIEGRGFDFKFIESSPAIPQQVSALADEKKKLEKPNLPTSPIPRVSENTTPIKIKKPAPPQSFAKNPYMKRKRSTSTHSKKVILPAGRPIDVSDTTKWPKANLLAKHFSGRIEKVESSF